MTVSTILKTTIYYAGLLGIPVFGGIYGYHFNQTSTCTGVECTISYVFRCIWLTTTPFLLFSYIGLVIYPATIQCKYKSISELAKNVKNTVYFRIVTRGQNPTLVKANVHKISTLLKSEFKGINYQIEVVTDKYMDLTTCDNVTTICVPTDFKTPHNTLYKARALYFASLNSTKQMYYNTDIDEKDWVLHLDEESKIDKRTLEGILTHISKDTKKPSIGQGVITYAPTDIQGLVHWIITLTDSLRVVNDYGAFRLQYQFFNTVYIGMKGSFVLLRNDIVRDVGWDHGPESSITEDAFFAMLAKDKGYKFNFINACVYELSPFTLLDLFKQRKRWMDGLWKVCTSNKITWYIKTPLFILMCLWSISWLSLCTFFLVIFIPHSVSSVLNTIFSINTTFIVISYVYGFFLTQTISKWISTIGYCKYILVLFIQCVGIPLFSFLEGMCVLYWFGHLMCNCGNVGFDVVKKEKKNDQTYLANNNIV